MAIPTPHINAKEGDFAKAVLMPGDPLRAKYIANTYLEGPRLVTDVRNVLGFTGTYKGEPVSVMASGMGMPSIGIYSYELYKFYGVESIIRVGSAGSISDKAVMKDIVIAMGASTTSSWQAQYKLQGSFAPICDFGLLRSAVVTAERLGTKVVVGNVLTEDAFYGEDPDYVAAWQSMGVLALEMEAAGLYMTAAKLGKKALAMFSISDEIMADRHLSSAERQVGFGKMIELALEMSKE